MNLNKLKKGNVVEITFWDHSSGDADVAPVKAVIVGKVQRNEEDHLVIDAWDSEEYGRHNCDSFAVMKSCITQVIIWIEGIKL